MGEFRFYRASSLNSVYSENSSATTSEPFNWLTVTLTKRELDKACKDSNHKIFSADFKVRGTIFMYYIVYIVIIGICIPFKTDDAVFHASWPRSGAFERCRKSAGQYGFCRPIQSQQYGRYEYFFGVSVPLRQRLKPTQDYRNNQHQCVHQIEFTSKSRSSRSNLLEDHPIRKGSR